jgi:hypothetical protein
LAASLATQSGYHPDALLCAAVLLRAIGLQVKYGHFIEGFIGLCQAIRLKVSFFGTDWRWLSRLLTGKPQVIGSPIGLVIRASIEWSSNSWNCLHT